MIRPKGEQLEISFSVSDTESWDGLVQNLNTFLSRKKPFDPLLLIMMSSDQVLDQSSLTCSSVTCLSAAYNDSYQVQTNDNCPPDKYFIQEDSGEVNQLSVSPAVCLSVRVPLDQIHPFCFTLQVRNNPKRSCQFNRTMLEDCSGTVDRFYGYNRGQPCILIKLNRVCRS